MKDILRNYNIFILIIFKKHGYAKSFYGAETELTKNNHHILIHHLENKIEGDAIVFFCLEQFRDSENKLNLVLMKKILESGYDLSQCKRYVFLLQEIAT